LWSSVCLTVELHLITTRKCLISIKVALCVNFNFYCAGLFVRPSHCGIKSKLITVGSCGFLQVLAPFMSACVNPRVGLQLSRMSRKYTIYLNMSLLGGIWVEIIWHLGGDRAEKRTVAAGTGTVVAGTGWGWGQRRWGRGGDGDKIVGMGWGRGQNILPCQSLLYTLCSEKKHPFLFFCL